MAETSDDVSAIAARLVRLQTEDLVAALEPAYHIRWRGEANLKRSNALIRDIRRVAASALRQDETPRRGLIKRLFGAR